MSDLGQVILEMADDIRAMDNLIFAMSQELSWPTMRPHFLKLLEFTMARREEESRRITNLMRRELISVYGRKLTDEQLKLLDHK